MRASILAIVAACTLAVGPTSFITGTWAVSPAGQNAAQRAPASGATPILLIDALSQADRDTARAVEAIASRIDVTDAAGIRLGQQLAPGWTPSSENLASIQSQTKAALMKGDIEGAILPLTAFLRQSALFGADQVPFLVVDAATNARLIEVLTPTIDDRLAENGLALLGLLPMRPVGIVGTVRKLPELPGRIAVSDAAGRRLAELIGAKAIETPSSEMQKEPVEFRYTYIPDISAKSEPQPRQYHGPDDDQFLAMAAWPLAMIVARRELVAANLDTVRSQFWPEAARQAEAIRKRWQGSMATPYWPTAATRLLASPAATGDDASNNAQANDRSQGHPAAERHKDDRDGLTRDSSEIRNHQPSNGVDRMRAAGLTMAREWAVGAGADGFTLLRALGLPIGEDR